MKIISLNIWGGKLFDPLMEFIKKESTQTDIFCLQEVWNTITEKTFEGGTRVNILKELSVALPHFVPYYAPTQDGFTLDGPAGFPASYGNAIFIRNALVVNRYGAEFVYKTRNYRKQGATANPCALQYVGLLIDGKPFTLFNFHGMVPVQPMIPSDPHGKDTKADTPERLDQAKNIRNILNTTSGLKILCGDFNLLASSKSMKVAAGKDLRNLISDYRILDTRGPIFQMPIRQADQMLVSKEMDVLEFSVPQVSVSDHLPLCLTVET